jgi:hypothetical protein
MSKPVLVQIPHRLGREEAVRRLKGGLGNARANFNNIMSVHEEAWNGDRLQFHVSALGQHANGSIDVRDDHVLLEVTLPWLLGRFVEKIVPAVRKQATLLLEKK